MNDKKLEWKIESERELLKTAVFTVKETTSISPEGGKGHYIVQEAPDWVIVVPEINGKFLMVRQWRHAQNALSIEFPGGVINKDEKPEDAARREMEEETGYKAGKLTYLGFANPNPALMRNRVHFFAAENLLSTGKQHLDDDEFVQYLQIPCDEVYKKIGGEEYPHALMMSALLKYKIFKCK
jgi:8-oxo-dGTP pyrophosphatase MutT (NUDIX family)